MTTATTAPVLLEHFGFRRYPFTPEIETQALLSFKSFHQGALRLEQAVHVRGMALVAGEPGAGKSALARSFCHRLSPSSFRHFYYEVPAVPNPGGAVVEALLTRLGEPVPFHNLPRGLAVLQHGFQRLVQQGQIPVVILDDVHRLTPAAWAVVKSMTNQEMDSRVPLLLVLLGGRQKTLEILSLNQLEEVRSRLLFCHHLQGLAEDETGPYIETHLKWAGCERALFPREVAREIHRRAAGQPRHVNRLGFGCLMAAAFDRKDLVDTPCLEQACSELLLTPEGQR